MPKDLERQLRSVESEKARLANVVEKAQADFRTSEGQKQADQLGRVEAAKADFAKACNEHSEIAKARATSVGGRNFVFGQKDPT